MATKYPTDQRRRDLAMIHMAKHQLGMQKDAYRDILWSLARVRSSADLDQAGRSKVLDHMQACGFKRTKPQPRALADDPQSKKIRALWLDLHEAGKVRNPSESALAAFVKRQTGRDALQWLTGKEASALIEELKKWLAR